MSGCESLRSGITTSYSSFRVPERDWDRHGFCMGTFSQCCGVVKNLAQLVETDVSSSHLPQQRLLDHQSWWRFQTGYMLI